MSPRPPFDAAGRVTGIGSLPLTDPEAAIRFVAEHSPEIPFWPQLPRRSEDEGMIAQAGGLGLDPDRAAGFFAFERALAAGDFPRAVAVKGQIAGPVTIISTPPAQAGALELPADFASAERRVGEIAEWQIARLGRSTLPVLLFLDEPALGLIPKADLDAPDAVFEPMIGRLLESIRRAGAWAGLHCCAEVPASFVRRVRPDIFSFDARAGLEEFCGDPEGRAYLNEGGTLALGLIPTRGTLDALSPEAIFDGWRSATGPCGDLRDLARRSLVTATCGLGTLDEAAARDSFELARRVSKLFCDLAAG